MDRVELGQWNAHAQGSARGLGLVISQVIVSGIDLLVVDIEAPAYSINRGVRVGITQGICGVDLARIDAEIEMPSGPKNVFLGDRTRQNEPLGAPEPGPG